VVLFAPQKVKDKLHRLPGKDSPPLELRGIAKPQHKVTPYLA
jgi:hypothetical protein